MANGNDPRLRQDKFERKDRENSNAGMIAGIIIILIGIVGIYLYYNNEVMPATTQPNTTVTQPPTATTQPTNTGAKPATP